MLRRFLLVVGFLATAVLVRQSLAQEQHAPKKPHIIHIVADDLGWKDVGFNGATDIKTPNLDALAAGGAKFTQFYVQPMCTPTRAALMTGRYPFRYGLQTAVIPSVSAYGLDTTEWLMPQALKEAGYKTAIIGKWHLPPPDTTSRPCGQEVLAQAGRLRLPVRGHDRRARLLHARRARCARLVSQQRAGQGGGLHHDAPRQGRRKADRGARSLDASLSLPRLQRAAHAVSGAEGIYRSLSQHLRPHSPDLCRDGRVPGRRDRPGPRRARKEEDA